MIFSINNVLLELNGHTVEGGWSDDADALMFEPITLISDPKVGAGGDVAYVNAGNKGGQFTLKFLPNAPSLPFFIQQSNVVRAGGSVIWDGSIRDIERGVSVRLVYGAIMSFLPFPTYGNEAVANFEFPFHFREIVPNWDAVTPEAFVRAA